MPKTQMPPERKSAHVPKLSYRNSVIVDTSHLSPLDHTVAKNPSTAEVPRTLHSETATSTSSNIGTATQSGNVSSPISSSGDSQSPMSSKTLASPTTQKKKGLFGGLFVTKEPTALALEKLAAQLEAQHGELSARAIPGVSSSKLPQHVPRVNTKWDGVPEALKEREKLQKAQKEREKMQKEQTRTAKRHSLPPSTRSRSPERSQQVNEQPVVQRLLQERISSSTLSSFNGSDRVGHNEQSIGGSSDEEPSATEASSLDAGMRQRSGKSTSTESHSLHSPSGSSLAATTATGEFADDVASLPAVPTRSKREYTINMLESHIMALNNPTRVGNTDPPLEATNDMRAEHISSPTDTPLHRSPVVPSLTNQSHATAEPSVLITYDRTEEACIASSGAAVLGSSTSAIMKRQDKAPNDVFLAGEAQPFELPDDDPAAAELDYNGPLPGLKQRKSTALKLPAHALWQQGLEKRPDSSRARLGLRASIILEVDEAPWLQRGDDKTTDNDIRSASSRSSILGPPPKTLMGLGKAHK